MGILIYSLNYYAMNHTFFYRSLTSENLSKQKNQITDLALYHLDFPKRKKRLRHSLKKVLLEN